MKPIMALCIYIAMSCHFHDKKTRFRIAAPSKFKIEQKLIKMVYIILNFLVLPLGENFMRIRIKIPKLQMHENLHKM